MSWTNQCSGTQHHSSHTLNKNKTKEIEKSLTGSSRRNSGICTVTTVAQLPHCCQGNQMTLAYNPKASVPQWFKPCHSSAAHMHTRLKWS